MDLSTPREHADYREIKKKPESQWTEADRRLVAWIEGGCEYRPTYVGD